MPKRLKHLGIRSWREARRLLVQEIDGLKRHISGVPSFRTTEVAPNLFVGGQYARRGWPKLAERGITAVVNMRSGFRKMRQDFPPVDRLLRLPTPDNTPPTIENLQRGVAFISQEIKNGGKVYVHCRQGVGRGPTMAAAYLVSTGLTPEQAWAQIRAARPFIRPTRGQREQIERFAALLAQE